MKKKTIFQYFFPNDESESLDYKSTYHEDLGELLHDILCLANADCKSPRQIIFGVGDRKKSFPGIQKDPNRKNQTKLMMDIDTGLPIQK
jgi:hypothetical protein